MISEITKFPRDLLEALVSGEAVGLIGSGLSISSGLPSWIKFLELMISECEEQVINFKVGNELRDLLNENRLLLVAEECRRQLGMSLYRDFIQKTFISSSFQPSELHGLICKLPFNSVLTTNYDCLLEKAYSKFIGNIPPIYTHQNKAQLSRVATDKNFFILKFHGHVEDIENIILTQADYQNLIHQNQALKVALTNICSNKTLVIIGYGLRDPDLNLVLTEQVSLFKGFGRRHYALFADPGTIGCNPI